MAERGSGKASFGAKNLACVRGGRVLFEGLMFSLQSGEALLVRGPNGSGKTSLLRLLAGLLSPQDGTILWNGEEAGSARKLIPGACHYLGHAHALKSHLTVLENLALWAGLYGGEADIVSACGRVGLKGFEDFPVRFLSEGQRKRVNLARLIAVPLPLWFLDEPAAGLDREGRAFLGEIVEQHLKGGGIVVAATHQELGVKAKHTITLGERP